MGKGGGSAPQPTTQTVQQSNIPEYARPYFEDIMTRGTAASNVAYQPFTGERVAPFTPLQQQAFQGAQELGPSPLIGAGAGLTGLAAGQAAQASQYQPLAPQQMYQGPQFQGMGLEYLSTQAPQLQQYQMGPAQQVQAAQTGAAMTDYAPNLRTFQMGPAERARTGSFAMPGAAEAYMSPYMQNVVDVQQREAQRQADIARTQRGAQAVGAGAFGGSRQAIMEAEAARNLAQQKGDIQAAGLQAAFQQAQQAYQTDAQRQLQAQLANQQAGLTVGGQNLAAALGVQQLGTQTGLQTALANQQAMQQAMMENARMQQQAALANQQAGLTVGQQNLAAALQTQGLGAQTGLQSQQLNQAAQLQAQQQALGQQAAANQFAQQNAQLAAQYGLAGLQAGEQSRQFGANLGMQGAGMLGQLGGQFGQLGQQAFGQQAAALEAQQRAGAIQQAQGQQQRDLAYEEFMRQQLYPQSQLQFLSSLLRGSVVAPQQTMYTYQQQPSMVSQLGGLGLGALGMSRAFGAKEGGEVPGYADGGVTGGDDKAQGVTPSRVSNVKKLLLSGVDPRKIPDPLGVMIALQDRDFVKQLQLSSAAKNQQALEGGRQQAPSVYDEKMGEAAGLAAMDAGVMEEPYAGGGIVAFNTGTGPSGVPFSAQDILPEDIEEARRNQGRTPFIEESPKERAARLRAAQARALGIAPPNVSVAAEAAGKQGAGIAAEAASKSPSLLSRGLGALGRIASSPLTAAAGLMSYSPEAGAGSDIVAGKPAGRQPTAQDINAMLSAGTISDAKARELLRKAAATSSLQSQYEAQDRQEGRTQAAPGAQTAPGTQAAPGTRAVAPARAAAPAVDEFAAIRKTVEEQRKTLQTEDQAEAARREAYKKIIPDDLQQRLDTYKAEAAQAVQERDKDRWLAVAMGGFAAAAGQSPYALQNFAQGLGLTAKETMSINKDFRKLENERNKLMREEQRLDRAEKIGVEKDILAARERAAARRDSFNQFSTNVELNLTKIANDRWKTLEEGRSRERVAGIYAGSRGAAADVKSQKDALQIRYNALVREGKGDSPEAQEILAAIRKYSEATKARENPTLQILDQIRGSRTPGAGGRGVLKTADDGVLEYKPAP